VSVARALVLALCLAGCSLLSAKPDTSRYYVLAAPFSGNAQTASSAPLVGLGPIALPGYLDRNLLVTRLHNNELKVSLHDHWAEPLDHAFAATLRQAVAARIGADRVVLFPWQHAREPAWIVTLDVERFERVAGRGEEAELWVRFEVRDAARAEVVAAQTLRIQEPVHGGTTEAAVAALSSVLVTLGHRIADTVLRASASAGGAVRSALPP
jgi:uncharacterized lipoprotein YmbA